MRFYENQPVDAGVLYLAGIYGGYRCTVAVAEEETSFEPDLFENPW